MKAAIGVGAALAAFLALPALADDDSARLRDYRPAVTAEQAQEIALRQRPGRVEEVDLEHDDGRVVWEVEIEGDNGQDFEVIIDAASGEVLEVDD